MAIFKQKNCSLAPFVVLSFQTAVFDNRISFFEINHHDHAPSKYSLLMYSELEI